MLKNLLSVTNMQKCAALLVIACLFVCLTFNSTLPIYKGSISKAAHEVFPNMSQRCVLIERTKKMASNLENTLRRIKDSTQDFGKSIYDHLNTGIKTLVKDPITEDEIRQYEELVIMKKYPYLDLKALEMKYNSLLPVKNTRQSATFFVDRNLQNEPGINCDPVEDLLNVEIINRGLSGFSIPSLLAKHTESADSKLTKTIVRKTNEADEMNTFPVMPSDSNVLKSLKDDIKSYVELKVRNKDVPTY